MFSEIATAFADVPAPGPESRTLGQAEAWDAYASVDGKLEHRGSWEDLPIAELREAPNALPHLDAVGIRYYLPAIMSSALRAQVEPPRLPIHDALVHLLTPSPGGELREYQRRRLSLLSSTQRAAVLSYLRADPETPAALSEIWRRALSPNDERWFTRFSGARPTGRRSG